MAADREILAQMGSIPYAAKGFTRIPDGRKVTSHTNRIINQTLFYLHKYGIKTPTKLALRGTLDFALLPLPYTNM